MISSISCLIIGYVAQRTSEKAGYVAQRTRHILKRAFDYAPTRSNPDWVPLGRSESATCKFQQTRQSLYSPLTTKAHPWELLWRRRSEAFGLRSYGTTLQNRLVCPSQVLCKDSLMPLVKSMNSRQQAYLSNMCPWLVEQLASYRCMLSLTVGISQKALEEPDY